jgi:histidinol-phosphate aminotransferase
MNLYPDGGAFYLARDLAKRLNVKPEEIIFGNGSDEITLFMALAFLAPGRNIVTSQYSFIRYRMAATLVGAKSKVIPMKDFRHDVSALARAVDKSTIALFIDNPCNPTGAMTTRAELTRLLKRIPKRAYVVLDEAYYEYACAHPKYPNTLALRKRHPNLIVTRTFSKAYGLAGLRIGYAVAPAEVVADLDRVRPPFNVNRIAQIAARAALRDRAHLRRGVSNNEKGKRFLTKAFRKLDLAVTPTWGNFILVGFAPVGLSGAEVYESLLRRGVIVRPMAGYGLPDHLRISIGTPKENRKLVHALIEAC